MEHMKIGAFFLVLIGLCSCSSKKEIGGLYRSNFADMGFFITTLKIKSDNTFEYSFRGDLISNKATGHYEINQRKLRLTYDLTPLDTNFVNQYRTMGIQGVDSMKNETSYPSLYYIRDNKLFHSWQGGKIVRRARTYSERKKYLFFGSNYYKKIWYLQKIE